MPARSPQTIATRQGKIVVWTPGTGRAGLVIYIHGHGQTATSAWMNHRLASQFARSRLDSTFVAVDGQFHTGDTVKWTSLDAVLAIVETVAGEGVYRKPVTVIAHSAGYETVARWLEDRRIGHIILLDALYGRVYEYLAWLHYSLGGHAITTVYTKQTAANVGRLLVATPHQEAALRDGVPSSVAGFTRQERGAKLLAIRSQYTHNEIVASGAVIPIVLRRRSTTFGIDWKPVIAAAVVGSVLGVGLGLAVL